ncbi:MAG: hypothetical protein KDK78_11300, partial [Chlamydiia bacterium]|nr:hypothetical protein [Chlamydiia bacterium]
MRSWLRGCLCALALIEGASLMADMRSNYGCLAPNWHDDYDDCVVEYSLLIDRHFSPEVGAENIISAYRLYEMLDCWDIEPDILRCQDAWG